jgi:hypothetical protein
MTVLPPGYGNAHATKFAPQVLGATAEVAPEHCDPRERVQFERQFGLIGVVVGQNALDLIERCSRKVLNDFFSLPGSTLTSAQPAQNSCSLIVTC